MSRSFDELVAVTEHAEPIHPIRALFKHHFYLDDLVTKEGGLWLLLMFNALLLVPLIMAAFFYPIQVLALVGVLLLVSFTAYEGYVIWRRRHAAK